MGLKKEEIDSIKTQLLGQVENFPEEKRGMIKEQISSMSDDQVEEFVKQNQLTHMPGGCIFCAIVEGKNPAVKIDETETDLAILEINPLSKGHVLVVPKKHREKVEPKSNDFAEEISKKIKKILSPKDVVTREIKIMDHAMLEVVPIYGNETERKQATPEELEEVKKILTQDPEKVEEEKPPKKEKEEVEEPVIKEIPKLPPRIPHFS